MAPNTPVRRPHAVSVRRSRRSSRSRRSHPSRGSRRSRGSGRSRRRGGRGRRTGPARTGGAVLPALRARLSGRGSAGAAVRPRLSGASRRTCRARCGSTGGVRVSRVRPCRAGMAKFIPTGRGSRPSGRCGGRVPERRPKGGPGVSAVGRGGAPRVSSGCRAAVPRCPLAESSPQIRGSPASRPNSGAPRRRTKARRGDGPSATARRRHFCREPGLRTERRGTRGGGDPAVVSCARAASRSGRTVTQKHRRNTLRSTSGGCLRVTHREDCGRVPSKRRCCRVRIMPIAGRHALRLRILTPRSQDPGPRAPLSFHEPGGSRAHAAREVSPRGWVMSGWRAARPGSLRGRGRPRGCRVLHRMC